MAFREVGMFEVKEVLQQLFESVPKKRIARTVGIDVKTVRSYAERVTELGLTPPVDDEMLNQLFAALRADDARERGEAWRLCAEHRETIKALLAKGVRLSKVGKLLEREGVVVPYSTLHRFARSELSFGRTPSVRLVDGKPGEEIQIDTGWVVTLVVDGKEVKRKAFIFTPNVSRYRFVYPIERETTDEAIEACEAAWAFYGGVFHVAQPDNMKAIVEKASATSPQIVEAFREYAQARGFTLDPTRVRHPKDKARVERTVRFVREDCFGGEKLHTLDEARTRALYWSAHEAGARKHRTTQRRPREHFESDELALLLPAPTTPWDIPTWATVKVDQTQHVSVESALYQLPAHCIGRKLRARADKQLVRFYDRNVLVKTLPRAAPGGRSFDEHDIPEEKRAYALRDGAFLAQQARAHSAQIGDYADRLLEGRAPWTRLRRVTALLSLVRRFGVELVTAQCARALDADMVDVDRLRRMIEQPKVIDDEPRARVIPIARFLRPASTYALADAKQEKP
jgi:transposase